MPVDFLTSVFFEGTQVIPYWDQIKQYGPTVIPIVSSIVGLKYYFRGATNTWDRDMHGKVFLVTGGTSGLGSRVVYDLATRGAQLILLTRRTNDSWLAEYIEDMRDKCNNPLIYAEECDLASLYSVRKFATSWLDNTPPRRLDGIICCAAECIPRGNPRQITIDGVERQIGVNYLGHFQLLTLIGPCLRVQPPDRDVRIVIATCSSQNLGDVDETDLLWDKKRYPSSQPWKVYGTSKLLLGLAMREYQSQFMTYQRKDLTPCNVRINTVNPGILRSPSTRRTLSMGTVWGLLLYIIMYPIWWLCLKSLSQGAQSFYFALFSPILMKIEGGVLVQECKINTKVRKEYGDPELCKRVFEQTEALIKELETKSAIERKKTTTKEEQDKETQRKRDLGVKPRTTDELQVKLDELRGSIGKELPLFPDESALKATGAIKNNAKKRTKSRKS
ncbi:putative oxidoreductase [Spathaspora sp. JA1]|nr:putative oxidoreductase [Spathaspora sp. JA1]